jgi:hypothetical protein
MPKVNVSLLLSIYDGFIFSTSSQQVVQFRGAMALWRTTDAKKFTLTAADSLLKNRWCYVKCANEMFATIQT